eukprot:1956603-Amphidinium_carterae.1
MTLFALAQKDAASHLGVPPIATLENPPVPDDPALPSAWLLPELALFSTLAVEHAEFNSCAYKSKYFKFQRFSGFLKALNDLPSTKRVKQVLTAQEALGGMRHSSRAVGRLPSLAHVGREVRHKLQVFASSAALQDLLQQLPL